MSDENSAQEPTNFPVGNRDEVPSESPEKVETPKAADGKVVPNDTPEKDVADAKADRADGTPGAAAGGTSIETPATDPNRADAKPAADQAADKLNS